MDLRGTVTSIDRYMGSFKIDDRVIVYSHHSFEGKNQKYPKVGQSITVKNSNFHQKNNAVFLCEHCVLECEEYEVDHFVSNLVSTITKYNFGTDDILETATNLDVIRRSFNGKQDGTPENILVDVLRILVNECEYDREDSQVYSCSSKIMKEFTVKTPSDLKYVDIIGNKDKKAPYWSFGVHHNLQKEYLVGFLRVHETFGWFTLKDENYYIFCIVINFNSNKHTNILNKYILVKKHIVFTELFNREENVGNVEYLMFDINDIEVLDFNSNQENKTIFLAPNQDVKAPKFGEFKILHKSTICIDINTKKHFWLEVEMKQNDEECLGFIYFPGKYIQYWPLFEINHSYELYCNNNPFKRFLDREIQRLKKHDKLATIDENNVYFKKKEQDSTKENQVFLTVDETIDNMKNLNGFISFEGVLKIRKFNAPLPSRTNRGIKQPGFGTIGAKQYMLEFLSKSWDQKLVMYVNNWENMLVPLGLIPDMKIIVRNVVVQNHKYLKCTALTTFTVVSYEPPVLFNTVNLYTPRDEWGLRSPMGAGRDIPSGALVWNYILKLKIRSLSLHYLCAECGVYFEMENKCRKCGSQNKAFHCKMTAFVTDEHGEFKIISNCVELFAILFQLEAKEFQVWLKGFAEIGYFDYSKERNVNSLFQTELKELFLVSMCQAVEAINLQGIPPSGLCIQCRKLDSKLSENNGIPLWYCVKAKVAKL